MDASQATNGFPSGPGLPPPDPTNHRRYTTQEHVTPVMAPYPQRPPPAFQGHTPHEGKFFRGANHELRTRKHAVESVTMVEPLLKPHEKVSANVMSFYERTKYGEEEPPGAGEPQRPPASAQMNVNSIDRYGSKDAPASQFAQILQPWVQPSGTIVDVANQSGLPPAANSFTYNLQRPLLNGYLTRLGVSQVNLDWNVPNIIQGYNDKILVGIGNVGVVDVTLSPGFYSGPELAANISTNVNTALNGAGIFSTFLDCSWSARNGRLAFGTQNPSSIINTLSTGVFFDTANLAPKEKNQVLRTYNTIGVTYPQTRSTLFYQSSLSTFSSLNTGFNLNPYKTPYTSYIDIISDKLSQYMRVKDGETAQQPETNVLARVWLTPLNKATTFDASGAKLGTTPFTLTWDPNTMKWFRWSPNEAVFDFDIQVKDEYGNLVPWSGSRPFEFNMTMLASET